MASNRELSTIGRTLAEVQDEALGNRARPALSAQVAAIYQLRARRERMRRRWSRFAYGAGAAVLAAAVTLFVMRPRVLEFRIDEGARVEQLGVLIAAPGATGRSLSFSDGSRLQLHGGAQARVVSRSERGARIVLERGRLRADVVPRPNGDWSLFGGPFEIHVTGTSFETSWDTQHQQLFVQMREGHVLVSGECLPTPRALKAGQSATFSCPPEPVSARAQVTRPTTTESVPSTAPAGAAAAAPAPPLPRVSAHPAQSQPAKDAVAPVEAPVPRTTWRELSARGDYAGSLAAAELEGFERLCETLSSTELLELASNARLVGRSERANAGYAAIRRRFVGSEDVASAAFHLGQLAFDSSHDFRAARRLFAAYLAECRNCALAPEALGRRMEAEQRLGELSLARASARLYLEKYPKGAHARLAQSFTQP